MEISTEVISISKIRDGIFIGDMRAGINLDLLMQFKISHIINATGMKLPYTFESIRIKYLTIEWSENPKEDINLITNDIVSKIISFIDDSLINGEGLFGFSFNGKNRICVVIIIYLMTKFMWPLKKCMEYVKKKKADIDINTYYKNQLTEYEKKFFENDNTHIVQPKLFWNIENLKDKNELLMRNTYMNEVKNYNFNLEKNNLEKNNLEDNKIKNIRHVEWGDNKKYARQMIQPGLIHYNIDKDLFLKKNIEDITEHLHNKPLRSCMKNSSNINVNSNASSTIRRKKKKTKIYLAADVNPMNNSNKNSISNNINNSPTEECNDEILTLRSNQNNNDNKNNNNKKHFFENILNKNNNEDKEDIKEEELTKTYENEEILNNKNKEKYSSKNNENSENHLVNNLFITSTKICENDSDDEIKLNNIINIAKNREKNEINNNYNDNNKENKNNNKIIQYKKDLGFNIINIENQKIANNNIKPILNNLLKIDPNFETLKKYLKANKKKSFTNLSNTFPNFKINNINKTKNINSNSDNNNNSPTINTISNNDNNNKNTVNLIPIQMNKNNINNQNKTKKIIKKEEKKNNGIYLLNFNLNIDNRTTLNIKNNFINNENKGNSIGFNRKLNNFFMDSNGNSYFNSFNKFKNRRSNTSEGKDTINNHKYLSPKINYYLGKQDNYKKSEDAKKENIMIPNITLNNNNYSINNPRNNNKSEKTKIFMRQNINIDKNNINNMINNNKNLLINNITNNSGFNRKESKFNNIIFDLIL